MVSPRGDVEPGLRRALEQGALTVLYQPVVDLHDATLGGVEALLRWRHQAGVLAAGAFLPAVEDRALLEAIADFVFAEAAQQAAEWRRRFEAWLFPVSVNVAPSDFRGALVDRVCALRERYGLAPGALAVDLSEPVLLDDVDRSGALVAGLKQAGAQIVVDDFGSTHSRTDAHDRTADELMRSLVALEALPIDVVKVDRALIVRAFADPSEATLIEGTVKLAHRCGFRLLAEGVESGDEAERLRQAGFDLGQGYYFQRPHGAGHIDRLLHDLADARQAFAAASRVEH
jgi:EAL domain-containing protein (putative c-di-GMP-specific phosphodiesterase class I)